MTQSEPFLENQRALDLNFAKAYPEIHSGFQYHNYLLERERLSSLRDRYLKAEAKDIVAVLHDPGVICDRFFTTNCIFSNDDTALTDLYEQNHGPISSHDRRLLATAIGEWLVLGRTSLLEQWQQIVTTISSHYGIAMPNETSPQGFAQARYGLTTTPAV